MNNSKGKVRILFLGSSPVDAARLQLGKESRLISETLSFSRHHGNFEFRTITTTQVEDIDGEIFSFKPHVVHFSAHGCGYQGLYFEDQFGKAKKVETAALVKLFELASPFVRCVILNACYSKIQAEAIASCIPVVLGMQESVADESAINFSIRFYKALGDGSTFEEAFELGKLRLQMQGDKNSILPICISKHPEEFKSKTIFDDLPKQWHGEPKFSLESGSGINNPLNGMTSKELDVHRHYLKKGIIDIDKRLRNKRGYANYVELKKEVYFHGNYSSLPLQGVTDIAPSRNKSLVSTSILDIFEDPTTHGQFVLLGDVGSGKTLSLLQLTRQLLDRASVAKTEPLPLFLEITSWEEGESIQKFIFRNLNKLGIPKEIALDWWVRHKFIIIIDTFDGLNSKRQSSAVSEINEFVNSSESGTSVVIGCRTENYYGLPCKLDLYTEVLLHPLEKKQVKKYLLSENLVDTWPETQENEEKLYIFRLPIFLSQLIEIQQRSNGSFTKKFICFDGNAKEVYRYFFGAYVELAVGSSSQKIYKKKSRQWLIFLAEKLSEDHKTEFSLEDIQPAWLSDSRKLLKIYKYLSGLGVMIFASGPVALSSYCLKQSAFLEAQSLDVVVSDQNLYFFIAILGILFFFFLGFLLSSSNKKINFVETLQSPLEKLVKGVNQAGLTDRILGAVFNNIRSFEEVKGAFSGLRNGGIIILDFMLRGGLGYKIPVPNIIRNMLIGLQGKKINVKDKFTVNSGFFKSLTNALVYIFVFAIVGVFLSAILVVFSPALDLDEKIYFCAAGASIGTLAGLLPGTCCIQHISLRIALYLGGYIPWNYSGFLDVASTDYKFMERIGGRYRFVHSSLQEYFRTSLRIG